MRTAMTPSKVPRAPARWFLLFVFAHVASCARGRDICFTGYIMDRFCINRGTLLDNPSLETLLHPDRHSVHCLVDVPRCYTSGFEVLRDPLPNATDRTHCRAFTLDAKGNELALDLARRTGQRGYCSTCTGGSDGVSSGFRATVIGTVDDEATGTRILKTESVVSPSVGCQGREETVLSDNSCEFTAGGARSIVLAHASLMISGWGLLVPCGVVCAHFMRHRDPLWFYVHRALNSFGLLCALAGFLIAVTQFSVFSPGYYWLAQTHGSLGVVVMTLGIFQPINAFLRPHVAKDGSPKSPRRRCWERFHKGSGYFALVLALPTIIMGTFLVGGGSAGVNFRIALGVFIAAVVGLAIYLYASRTRDTPPAVAAAVVEEA